MKNFIVGLLLLISNTLTPMLKRATALSDPSRLKVLQFQLPYYLQRIQSGLGPNFGKAANPLHLSFLKEKNFHDTGYRLVSFSEYAKFVDASWQLYFSQFANNPTLLTLNPKQQNILASYLCPLVKMAEAFCQEPSTHEWKSSTIARIVLSRIEKIQRGEHLASDELPDLEKHYQLLQRDNERSFVEALDLVAHFMASFFTPVQIVSVSARIAYAISPSAADFMIAKINSCQSDYPSEIALNTLRKALAPRALFKNKDAL